MQKLYSIFLLSFLLIAATLVNAQTFKILGTTQSNNSALPKVGISITNANNEPSGKSITDSLGKFRIENLLPGKYIITPEATGYIKRNLSITVTDSDLDLGIIDIAVNNAVSAGPPFRITGSVLDADSQDPLDKASLKITNLKGFERTILTDSSGNFATSVLDTGKYAVTASFIGYDDVVKNINIIDNHIEIGEIFIFTTSKTGLDQVVVTGRTPPARQKNDTTELNAAAFKVNPDATVEDLIKKAPGITVQNGTITAQGEEVRRVTIDGRQYFGDDATAALKNLPADIVDKIQVFDRLSDQSQLTGIDDGNSSKSLNIVTKANMRNGQFGRIYAGYGTDDRYSAGGSVNFFSGSKRINLIGLFNNVNQQNFGAEDLLGVSGAANQGGGGRGGQRGGQRPGGGGNFGGGGNNFSVGPSPGIAKTNSFGINYSDTWGKKKNMEFTGSYFFNNSNTATASEINREQFMDGDTSRFTNEITNSTTKNINHRVNGRLEYKIDSMNTIIANANVSFQNNNSESLSNNSTIGESGFLISDQVLKTVRESNAYNFSSEITYRRGFKKRGRSFTANLRGGSNDRNNYSSIDGTLDAYEKGILANTLTRQKTDNLSDGYNISSNITYSEPVSAKGILQFNYNPQYTKSNADQKTLLFDENTNSFSKFDTSQSNLFENTVIAHNAGITYRLGDNNNQVSVGLNYQNTNLASDRTFPFPAMVDKSYNNILPSLMYNKKVGTRGNFRFNYRASVSAPNVNQLQDVVNKTNPLFISSGNKDLDQSYTHRIFTRFNYTNPIKGESFFINGFVQKVNGYVANATYIPTVDSVLSTGDTVRAAGQFSKPVNLDGYYAGRLFVTYGVPVKALKTNININAGFNYTRLPGMYNYVKNISNTYSYNAGITFASNISEYIDFNVNYTANFNTVKNTIRPTLNNKYYFHTAGVKVNLLTKNGWFLLNDINNQFYSGLADGFNQNFWLWNTSVGKKILHNQRGEVKLTVFDLLNQNQSIARNVYDNYIEDSQTVVLRQYFMLTFTYTLKNFGTAKAPVNNNSERQNSNRMR